MKFITKINLCFVMLMVYSTAGKAQASETDNFGSNPLSFLGWDNTTTFPLNIRHHRNNQPIDFWTNNVCRLRINDGTANPTLNVVWPVSTAGFVGIDMSNQLQGTGPFSLLHLNGEFNGGAPQ